MYKVILCTSCDWQKLPSVPASVVTIFSSDFDCWLQRSKLQISDILPIKLAGDLKKVPHISEFPFTHSCAYLTHKNLKGRSLFHASASQGCMEACFFYKLHNNLSA